MNYLVFVLVLILILPSVGLPIHLLWMSCGQLMRYWMKNRVIKWVVEWILAASLLGVAVSLAFKQVVV